MTVAFSSNEQQIKPGVSADQGTALAAIRKERRLELALRSERLHELYKVESARKCRSMGFQKNSISDPGQ